MICIPALVSILLLVVSCGSMYSDLEKGISDDDTVALWTRLLGVAGVQTTGSRVAVDSSGNSYVTGTTNGNLDGQILTGTRDAFVIKYDINGNKQWTRLSKASSSETIGYGITVDASGNCYISGQTYTGSAYHVFIVKFDSSGNMLWTRTAGVAFGIGTYGRSLCVDASGNVYVTGVTYGSFDGQAMTGSRDVFVTKYNTSGALQWTRFLGAAGAQTTGESVCTDAAGTYCYVVGETNGGLDGETLNGTQDGFIVKYDASGALQWTMLNGVAGVDTDAGSISVDVSGNFYVSGSTKGNLGGQTLNGTTDAYVIKYDASGAPQWIRLMGVTGSDTNAGCVSVDQTGNYFYITGSARGNLNGQTLTGTTDVFVIQYTIAGVRQWTRLMGVASATTNGSGIAVGPDGIVRVNGTTNGNLDGQIRTGTSDVFITTRLNQ
jgi:hypothetical protein